MAGGSRCPSGAPHYAICERTFTGAPVTVGAGGAPVEFNHFITDDPTWFLPDQPAAPFAGPVLQRNVYGFFVAHFYLQTSGDIFRGTLNAGLLGVSELSQRATTTIVTAQEMNAIGYDGGIGTTIPLAITPLVAPGTYDSAVLYVGFWPMSANFQFVTVF